MKYLVTVIFAILFLNSDGQQLSKDELYIPEFKWKMKIPGFLISENTEEWNRMRNAGKKNIEDAYDIQIKNQARTIFIFRTSDTCFFEAVSEPVTTEEAENYIELCEKMNDIIYNTLKTQAPSAKIDTTKSVKVIDGLEFQAIKTKLTFPDGLSRTSIVNRRVFEGTELTVNVMYSNQKTGEEIMKIFLSSGFEKKTKQ